MASVTFRLLSRYGKPPISYMGSKVGYADTILDALGLVPGQGADGIVLADAGPATAVLATLGNAMPPEDAARWLWVGCRKLRGTDGFRPPVQPKTKTQHGGVSYHPDSPANAVEACNLPASKAVANIIRQWKDEEPRALWERLKAEGWPSLLPVEGGRWLGPQSVEEVAGYIMCSATSYKNTPSAGFNSGAAYPSPPTESSHGHVTPRCPETVAPGTESLPTFPPLACYQGSADEMLLPDDLTGWIIYFDPPYLNTSGYPFGTLGRAEVLRLAKDWAVRGAIVAVSEAEPLPLEGWHHVQIDHARKGAKRTFSKQQDEWLTMNRPPAHVPAKQFGLFGGGQ